MSEPELLDRFRRHDRGGWGPEDALATVALSISAPVARVLTVTAVGAG